jgi:hypothetical protein
MAVRACLRDKEAARRYRPQIEQFIASHREEIESVLAATQPRGSLAGRLPAVLIGGPDGLRAFKGSSVPTL